MALYQWDVKKNDTLKEQRDIGFEAVVEAITSGNVVDDFPHPNRKKYPLQRMMVVIIHEYAYLVPYIDEKGIFFLKTIIPSRKAKKRYMGKIKEGA